MTPKSKPSAKLTQTAYADLKKLPGNTRRLVIQAIDRLENDLRPPNSREQKIEEDNREVRRLRIGKWRIIYLILDEEPIIIGLRHRPPYDYSDLEDLINEVGE